MKVRILVDQADGSSLMKGDVVTLGKYSELMDGFYVTGGEIAFCINEDNFERIE